MRLKGICYDVGAYMGMNWRPDFDLRSVKRELQIIKDDLHCNAIRITSRDISRLTATAKDALEQGLEVWFSPVLWDETPESTLEYVTQAARVAESISQNSQDKMVFVLGGELTIFMRASWKGRTLGRAWRTQA
jgi:hypothetical protein